MRYLLAAVSLLAASVLLAVPVGAKDKPTTGKGKPQAISVESWLRARTGSTMTRGTVDACVKVSIPGASIDETGGGPSWSSGTYHSKTGNLDSKCAAWTLAGTYRFEGKGHLKHPNAYHVLFARHVITTTHGTFSIQFTGKYSSTLVGAGRWTIKGGTGIYKGLQGTGTWTADGSAFPYFAHTETGKVHWTGTS